MTDDEPSGEMLSLSEYEMACSDGTSPMLEDMLDNPVADAKISKMAIERAVAGDMAREMAERLYGLRDF